MRAKFKNSLFGYSKKQVDSFVNGLNTEEMESRLKQLVDENVKLSVELKVAKSGYADAAELLGETRMRVRELEEQLASERYRSKQTENKFNRILEDMKQDYTMQIEALHAELHLLRDHHTLADLDVPEYQPRNIEKIKQDVYDKPLKMQRKPLTADAAKSKQQRIVRPAANADDWPEIPTAEPRGEMLDDVISSLVELQQDADDDFEQQVQRQEQEYSLEARAQQVQHYASEQSGQSSLQQSIDEAQVYGDDVFKKNVLESKLRQAQDDYNTAAQKAEREYRDSVYEANGDDFDDIYYTPPAGMEYLLDNEPKGGARGVMNRIYKLRSAMNTPSADDQFASRIPHNDIDFSDEPHDNSELFQRQYQQAGQQFEPQQQSPQYEQPVFVNDTPSYTYEQPLYAQSIFEQPSSGQHTYAQPAEEAYSRPSFGTYSQPTYDQSGYSQQNYDTAMQNYNRLDYEQPYGQTVQTEQHAAPTYAPHTWNVQSSAAASVASNPVQQAQQNIQQNEYSYNQQGTRPTPQAVSPRNIRR